MVHLASESLQTKMQPVNVGPMDIIPSWASVIYATADVQMDHFWYAIRAWGYGLQSQLIRSGMVFSFDELYRVCLESLFPIEGNRGLMRCPAMLIDSGHRTDEVYVFAHQRAPRIIPIKGSATKGD